MAQYPFLSEEWVAEAKKIREEYADKAQAVPHVIRMNQIITEVPFSDEPIEAHLDTSDGEAQMDSLQHATPVGVTVVPGIQ